MLSRLNINDYFFLIFEDGQLSVVTDEFTKKSIEIKVEFVQKAEVLDDEVFEQEFDLEVKAVIHKQDELSIYGIKELGKCISKAKEAMAFIEENSENILKDLDL